MAAPLFWLDPNLVVHRRLGAQMRSAQLSQLAQLVMSSGGTRVCQWLRLQVLDEVADAPPNAAFAQLEGWRKLACVHQSAECGDGNTI
jgi:hypothetical protein